MSLTVNCGGDWAEKQGIILLFTAPYSSAANGVAECAFGVVFRTVRIMLIEAGMSHGWWAEAYDYAIKVGNLLPSTRHPGEIPEECWTGKAPIHWIPPSLGGALATSKYQQQKGEKQACTLKFERLLSGG